MTTSILPPRESSTEEDSSSSSSAWNQHQHPRLRTLRSFPNKQRQRQRQQHECNNKRMRNSSSSSCSTTTTSAASCCCSESSASSSSSSSSPTNNSSTTTDDESKLQQRHNHNHNKRHKHQRRRLRGTEASIQTLAHAMVIQRKQIIFITGAGLSVPSGVRPFRTTTTTTTTTNSVDAGLRMGLWNEVVWSMATRRAFRKNPRAWYRNFWIPHFVVESCSSDNHHNHHNLPSFRPNPGHVALDTLVHMFPNTVHQITQNIDGLQQRQPSSSSSSSFSPSLIEIHGRASLFRCCPDQDSTSSSSSSDDDSDPATEDESFPKKKDRHHSYPLRSQTTTTTTTTLLRQRQRQQSPQRTSPQTNNNHPKQQQQQQHSRRNNKKKKVRLGSHRQCQKYITRTQQQTMCPYQYARAWTLEDDHRSFIVSSSTTRQSPKKNYRSNNQNNHSMNSEKDSHSSANDTTTMTTLSSSSSNDSSSSSTTTTTTKNPHSKDTPDDDGLPTCPACGNMGLPLALLFDEGYHSHAFYQFEMAERWLERAELLVFVGTSFAQVRFTHVALQHARQHNLPVYNINVNDTLESTAVLNASNILGSAHEILPQLVQACQALSSQQHPK